MALFEYKAVSPSGETLQGTMEALSVENVIAKLQEDGNIPLQARPSGEGLFSLSRLKLGRQGLTAREVGEFTQQLSTLLGAGLPLDRSLQVLTELAPNDRAGRCVGDIRDRVREGGSLSDALEAQHGSFSRLYINMVRGIPDVMFFVFFPISFLLIVKVVRTWLYCPAGTPFFDGINFVGCQASDFIGSSGSWFAYIYDLGIACLALGIVFGAFAANVIRGALDSVPASQLETASAFGLTPRQIFWRIHIPQMWIYAWGGLTNIWVLIIKATSLLSLLGIQEAVFWAKELGAPQLRNLEGKYQHGDWVVYYFLILFVFYLAFTYVSETGFARARRRLARGMGGGA